MNYYCFEYQKTWFYCYFTYSVEVVQDVVIIIIFAKNTNTSYNVYEEQL